MEIFEYYFSGIYMLLCKLFHGVLLFNPLTPNALFRGRTLSPLNSRMASKVAVNSVLKFGGILFTAIRLIAVT